jgi:hypothetical protein
MRLVEQEIKENPVLGLVAALNFAVFVGDEWDEEVEEACDRFYSMVKAIENPDDNWFNGVHCGDCTKVCGTCLRCLVEEFVDDAKKQLEKLGN